jgi:Uma2 family endonuclease
VSTKAPSETGLVTGEELLAMGDIGPCELVEGRIVKMSPTGGEHGDLELSLARALGNFVVERKLGRVVVGEVGIYTRRKPDTVRGADLAFISKSRLPGRPGKKFLDVAPELVVEIMSPTDRWQDVRKKIEEYFAIGVERVWVVEPDNRAVLVYRSATEMQRLAETDILRGEGVLQGFEMPIATLFSEE